MPDHDQHPGRETHVHNFDHVTASGYRVSGSVEFVLKTQIQPVPPKPSFLKAPEQEHWQLMTINNEEWMLVQFSAGRE